MNRKLKFVNLVAGLAVMVMGGLAALSPSPAMATDSEQILSITVSPTRSQLELKPGETSQGNFTVRNTGTVGFRFRAYAAPYQVDNDYNNVFDRETNFTQIVRWISFDEDPNKTESWVLEPNEYKTIPFTVKVPFDVPAGGQYASLFAETVPDDSVGGVSQIWRNGMLLYAKVAGNTVKTGSVNVDRLDGWYNSSNIETAMTVKNTGNVDYLVDNYLKVRGLFGGTVYESEPKSILMLPDTEQHVEMDWNSGRAFGIYYVTISSGLPDKTFEEGKLVLVLPIWLIVLFGVVVFCVIYLIRRHMVRRKLRRLHRAGAVGAVNATRFNVSPNKAKNKNFAKMPKSEQPSLWAKLENRRVAKLTAAERKKSMPKTSFWVRIEQRHVSTIRRETEKHGHELMTNDVGSIDGIKRARKPVNDLQINADEKRKIDYED